MKPELVSFDLDGTLVEIEGVLDKFWYEKIPKLYSERHGIGFEEARKKVKKAYDDLGMNDMRWYMPSYWFRKFDLKKSPEEVLSGLKGNAKVYEDALQVLDKLHKKYDIVLVSNAPREIIEVELDGMEKYFKGVYSCPSDFNSLKIDKCYDRICRELRVEPGKVLHIGDSKRFDYEEPRKAGLNSVFLDRKGTETNVRKVKDLKEFLGMLD